MKSKRVLMGFAALLIFLFHFYIPLSSEGNIFAFAYLGVDIFFFVSAYSLGKKEDIKFVPFIKNRLLSVYIPFVIFALISFFYKDWKIEKLLKVLCGLDFFEKSGGAFLWYLIAIMFLYLLVPFFSWLKGKIKSLAFLILNLFWITTAFVLEYAFNFTNINILILRLPVFFIGFFYDEIKSLLKIKSVDQMNVKQKVISALIDLCIVAVGIILILCFGTKIKLNKPVTELYYIFAVPAVIGLFELFNLACLNWKFIVLEFLGKLTLEVYAFQMMFGYNVESFLLKKLKNLIQINPLRKIIAFLVTLLFIVLIAFIFHFLYNCLKSMFMKTNKQKEVI